MTYRSSRRATRRYFILATCLSITTASLTRTAFACSQDVVSPPLCQPAYVPLPAGASLTPNVPAIPFRNAYPAPFADATPLVLSTADGADVAAEVRADPYGGQLLVPLAPLAADTEYRVHYLEHCTNGSQSTPDTESVEHNVAFSTTGNVALPTSMGEITVRTRTEIASLPTNSSCGGTVDDVRAAVAEIVLHPSTEFRAVLPVSTVSAGIGTPDQGNIGAINYGTPDASEIVVARLYAACEPTSGLSPSVRALGHYVVHVDARVAGSDAVIPSIEVPVDLACGPITGDADGGTDGGTGSSGGGCSVGSQTSSSGAASYAELFALLGLATMRRMRRRRDQPLARRRCARPSSTIAALSTVQPSDRRV